MRNAFVSLSFLLIALTGCSYNHSVIKIYETENFEDGRFEIGDCKAWCNFTGTRDTNAKKHRVAGPYRFTFNTRVTPEHTVPVVVSKLSMRAPSGEVLDLRPNGEDLVIDLRKGEKHRITNSKEVNFSDRRVIYWRTDELPFRFDAENAISVELEASMGDSKVQKTIIYQPKIKKQHKTPLNVFDNV